MNEPFFSIITPSYNYAKYVRDCIESVLAQDTTDGATWEHIVYDAGSTDGTLDILQEYTHLDLVVEPDKGMSDAINKGWRRARGKWVMWLNTDDTLTQHALTKIKKLIDANPQADVAYSAWNFVDAGGSFIRAMKALPYSRRMMTYYGCYIPSTALWVRKSTTIDEGILVDEKFLYNMDGEYYTRLGALGKKFVRLNTPLANFRLHDDALSAVRKHAGGIDEEFRRQKQCAEMTTISRVYGHRLFGSHYRMNNLVDALLFEFYRLKKGFLKLVTPWQN